MHGANLTKSKYLRCSLDNENDWHQSRNVVRATIMENPTSSVRETPTSSVRKGRSPSPSPRPPQRSATFSFTASMPKKEIGWNAYLTLLYFRTAILCFLSVFSMNACVYSLMVFICIIREANSITPSISTFTFWIC